LAASIKVEVGTAVPAHQGSLSPLSASVQTKSSAGRIGSIRS
jgi:hypothetical protein